VDYTPNSFQAVRAFTEGLADQPKETRWSWVATRQTAPCRCGERYQRLPRIGRSPPDI